MRTLTLSLCAVGLVASLAGAAEKTEKIPITTASEEARKIYVEARTLQENLRGTDARKGYEAALAKDPKLALAALGLATTGNGKQVFEALAKAKELAPGASEGERLLIESFDYGASGQQEKQRATLQKLVKAYPKDERAHNQLAQFLFFQQEFGPAIKEYKAAIAINATFPPPYNQLGYAYRFTGDTANAEATFKKYIELIPNDPNPYDSYAELLMKLGRFDESIKAYEKALSIQPTFVASLVGIGNNQMFQGKGDEARKTFARITQLARSEAEKRTANFWAAQSYAIEGQTDKAVAEMQKNEALSTAAKDLATLSADQAVIAEILLAGGKADEAAARFKAQVDTLEKADVPPELKTITKRVWLYDDGRVALTKGDLATAKARLAAFSKELDRKNGFEVRAEKELAGRIALAEKKAAVAVTELTKANNDQDPRVLYWLGMALQAKGDLKKAREALTKAADFNGFNNNYAYIRAEAKVALAKLST